MQGKRYANPRPSQETDIHLDKINIFPEKSGGLLSGAEGKVRGPERKGVTEDAGDHEGDLMQMPSESWTALLSTDNTISGLVFSYSY